MDIETLRMIIPVVAVVGMTGTVGWVVTTWLRVKHGYPLDGAWGQAVYPKGDESKERIKLLTQENATLHAELGAVKDRLANIERIVTDGGYHLSAQIDALRELPKN